MGNSGIAAPEAHESRFVADEAPDVLDVEHTIQVSGGRLTVSIATTRYVGLVDADGFLVHVQQHLTQKTLAEILLLTIRARIRAIEVGGTLGSGLLDVAVFLNEKLLGTLAGDFGFDSDDWQEFELDVNVRDVKFPADSGGPLVPVSNDITFEFTGIDFPILVEVDWLTLEPKEAPGLAWRPVILVHGLDSNSTALDVGSAWFDGLAARDVVGNPVNVTPKGSIINNGIELKPHVDALKARIGVEQVHMLGHSKGGVDGREYVKHNSDIEALIMLAAPNAGSFVPTLGGLAGGAIIQVAEFFGGHLQMGIPYMVGYNQFDTANPATTYVSIASDYKSVWALAMSRYFGPNDDAVSVESAHVLSYAQPNTYSGSDLVLEHMFIRFNTTIVDALFPLHVAVLTAPPRHTGVKRARSQPSRHPVSEPATTEQTTTELQRVMSASGVVASSVTVSHAAVIDTAGAAMFLMLGNQNGLRIELVSPAGLRIDPATSDAAAVYVSIPDESSLAYAAYHLEAADVGLWTLEVTGTDAALPEGTVYAVSALIPVLAGTGVSLTAALDQDHYAAGTAITITATVTDNGQPLTDAIVSVSIAAPNGTFTAGVALSDDGTNGDPAAGDGVYVGLFDATDEIGLYSILVSAERTDPAFRREQDLLAFVTQSDTTLSGSIADRGVDTDGDGLYNQLVIDVGVTVDVAGAYRVFGTLTDGAGTAIEQVRVEQELTPGLQTVSLAFDGAKLFALRLDGAYVIDDIVLEEVATGIGLGRAAPYTTAVYAHAQFQRPPCVLTGNVTDRGEHTDSQGQMPYEALVVEVEVDMLAAADVQAHVKLYAADGGFVASCRISAVLPAGISQLAFRFTAQQIFRSGKAGPYTVRLLSLWGSTVSLRVPGVVVTTQPYLLEDFAPPTRFTVGGTVTGLAGSGLVLQDLHFLQITPGNGPFTFPLPTETGDPYGVSVVTQPSHPLQICTIANGSGTVAGANISDIAVSCLDVPPNSALDPAFAGGGMVASGLPGGAIAMGLQSDGRIVLLARRVLTRYTTDGTLDTSFGTEGEAPVLFNGGVLDAAQGLAIQSDDKIVVVGFTRVGTTDDFAVARFEPNGTPDEMFGTGGKASVGFSTGTDRAWSALIQSDGAIVVAGHASVTSPLGPDNDFAVARFTPEGQLDMTFGDGGKVTSNIAGRTDLAVAAALQPDGKIVLAGRVTGTSAEDCGLARYTIEGKLDGDFGDGGIVRGHMSVTTFGDNVDGVAIQSDGKILVGGSATAPSDATAGLSFGFALARFRPDGDPDGDFGDGGVVRTVFSTVDDFGHGMTLQTDGRIVVVGESSNKLNSDFAVARYEADGAPDSSFGDGGKLTVDFFGGFDRADCVAIQPDGKILVAGSARNVTTSVLGLVRLLG